MVNSMNANESSTDERIGLQVTVCSNGVVNVFNPDGDHDPHSLFVDDGEVEHCSCRGWKFHGHCYHCEELQDRPLVLSSASAIAQSNVATDGGSIEAADTDNDERLPEITYHRESPEVGGQRYARCEGCGVESVEDSHGETSILHDDGCSHADASGGDGDDSRGVVDVGHCRCGNYVYGNDEYCSERCREKGPIADAPL
jgi:hypothetical protein